MGGGWPAGVDPELDLFFTLKAEIMAATGTMPRLRLISELKRLLRGGGETLMSRISAVSEPANVIYRCDNPKCNATGSPGKCHCGGTMRPHRI